MIMCGMIELSICRRDRFGNKTNDRLNFKSTDGSWLSDRFEAEIYRGKNEAARAKIEAGLYKAPDVN